MSAADGVKDVEALVERLRRLHGDLPARPPILRAAADALAALSAENRRLRAEVREARDSAKDFECEVQDQQAELARLRSMMEGATTVYLPTAWPITGHIGCWVGEDPSSQFRHGPRALVLLPPTDGEHEHG